MQQTTRNTSDIVATIHIPNIPNEWLTARLTKQEYARLHAYVTAHPDAELIDINDDDEYCLTHITNEEFLEIILTEDD